jgi:glyoxylase-like metal-dependent hydrolase (beta-lactamase superfamily II)
MITVDCLVFNPFQENTYVLSDETGSCVIVDPGCLESHEQVQLSNFIGERGFTPVMVLNTHLHLDHVFGNAYVAQTYNIPVYAHADDEFFLEMTQTYSRNYGIELEGNPPPLSGKLEEGKSVLFGNSKLQVIHVPGHSPGGVAFYHEESRVLISGDILFLGSIGRTDLMGGDYHALIEGIHQKMMKLSDDVNVYPGHGPSTTIGSERKHNPFLQMEV